MQLRLHILKTAALLLCFFLSGCTAPVKEQARTLAEKTSGAATDLQPLHTAPLPTASPVVIDKNTYEINEQERTFALKRTIIPKEGMPPMLLIVSGSIDEDDYWLFADQLIVADARTRQILQTYTLKLDYWYEPFWLITRPQAEKEPDEWPADIDSDGWPPQDALFIEDLNFDGWLDFRICSDSGAMNDSYWYWLWDQEAQIFERSMELDALHLLNPQFFQEGQYFTAFYSDSASDHTDWMYKYINGFPVLIKETKRTVNYDKEITHIVIRELVDGKLVIMEEYEKPWE